MWHSSPQQTFFSQAGTNFCFLSTESTVYSRHSHVVGMFSSKTFHYLNYSKHLFPNATVPLKKPTRNPQLMNTRLTFKPEYSCRTTGSYKDRHMLKCSIKAYINAQRLPLRWGRIWQAGSYFNHLDLACRLFFQAFQHFFPQHFPCAFQYFTANFYHLSTPKSPGCAGLLGEVLKGRELLPRPRLTEKQKITGVARQSRARPAAMAAPEQGPFPLPSTAVPVPVREPRCAHRPAAPGQAGPAHHH